MVRSLLFAFLFSSAFLHAQQGWGWYQRSNIPAPGRHRSVAITIGNKVYTGLGHVNAVVDILYGDWWEFDPGSNSWTQKANYAGGPTHHSFAFTIGNKGYVGTGRIATGANTTAFYCYDPLTNTWSTKAPFGGLARRGAVGFSIGNKGYAGTGNTSMSGYSNDFWEYDPAGDFWVQRAFFPPGGRFACVGFSIGSKGYIGTGEQSTPPAGSKNDLWEYDPATNQWIQKANVPGPNRLAACGFSCNGKGLVGTGEDFQSGNNFSDFHCFDPATNTWTTLNEFEGISRRYMVGSGVGTHAFVGWGTNGTNFNDWWELGYMSGSDEFLIAKMECYPNPATDIITLKNVRGAQLRILGLKGENVMTVQAGHDEEVVIDVRHLRRGVYVISVEHPGETVQTIKLVKQ
ncbi:MAG: T9SS type A sorting domain-containing protein [Bacteroidia bacterium]|nr:T9SS type A sorting domain-containing protein [Bacteroidia bacterium]